MSTQLPITDPLRLKLNQETARMRWEELQRFFAAGLVILVADSLDLIEVAVAFTNDDKDTVQAWLAQGTVAKASDDQAAMWLARDAQLWAVVVRPWILVQQEKPVAAVATPGATVH
jgi:hypothetical protein